MGKELMSISNKLRIDKDLPGSPGWVAGKTVFKPKQMAGVEAQPTVMPTPDDDAIKAVRRRRAAEMQMRGGRASTILSGEVKLGG